MQQMAPGIDNGDAHCPVVFDRFSLGSGGNGFDIGEFKSGLGFHG
jgi:hypothetical protein